MSCLGSGVKKCLSRTWLYVPWPFMLLILTVLQTGKKETLFNAIGSKHTPPRTRPLHEQDTRESQKLWHSTTQALIAKDQDLATQEKTKIEDQQREDAAKRTNEGVEWTPKLFRPVHGGPEGPDEGAEDLDWIINANVYVGELFMNHANW